MIRPAMSADVPALAAVAARSYRTAFAGILEQDILDERGESFFAKRFCESWPRMLVVTAKDDPAGFLLMTDGHIDMLFMDPAAGGRGGGALLLKEAVRRGARSLECFSRNYAARRFYERNGWRLARSYRRDFAGRERDFVFYVRDADDA